MLRLATATEKSSYAFGQNRSTLSKTYHRDIIVGKETLGRVTLVMNAQRLHSDVRGIMRRSIIMSLVSAALFGGMLYLFFRREIIQEMERGRPESERFREQSNFMSAVINTSSSYVLVIDPAGNIVLSNNPCVQLASEIHGAAKPVWAYFDIPCADRNLKDLLDAKEEDSRLANIAHLCKDRSVCSIKGAGGKDLITEWRFSQLRDSNGQVKYLIGTGVDVTEQHVRQEKLSFMAEPDALTSLPNRALLTRKVDESIQRYLNLNEPFAVLYPDLDRFKPINDTFGHEAGDFVLKYLSGQMRSALRDTDMLARVGGDDQRIAGRLIATVSKRFEYKNHQLQLGASIGVALFPRDAAAQDALFACADHTMYQAKQSGRNTYRFFRREAA